MQSNAPVPNDPQGGNPQDPKLLKQKKREEAEKAKKLQQEKRRQVELNMQLGTFSRTLATSVMDTSTMMKLACNTLKSMLQCDHVAISVFEDHPEIRQGVLCLGKSESNLPKLPPPPQPKKKEEDNKPKIKRMMVGDEVIEIVEKPEKKKKEEEEKDKEPEKPKPMFPVAPKEPFKPGTLPRLEYIIWDIPLMYKMRDIKQPAMIPDPSKFPDPELVKFAGIYLIKSVLFVPIIATNPENNEETVTGVLGAMNVNEPKVFTQTEISFAQKIIGVLSKAVNNAPPDLPVNVKKVITSISKDEASAEDVVQDFFINFWNRRKEVQIESSFRSYATGAVKNLSLSYIKKQPHAVELTDQIAAEFQGDYLEEEEALQFKETADEKVLSLVNLMPSERKKVFLQYVVDGLSYADIAKANNISINTVKTQMKRAYAFLKAKAAEDPLSIIFITILLGKGKF
ncbi:MAG: sigma-70 family RNA polymerase sigma factor [Pedobacter sp.]|nr:MAG: sigma-70 family RNA polymerase sigma factor [Pedobacter sp.]